MHKWFANIASSEKQEYCSFMLRITLFWMMCLSLISTEAKAQGHKISFGDRVIQGQRRSKGGVVLLQRPHPQISTIHDPKISFRFKIVSPYFTDTAIQD
jgi:hypothetical protein